MVVRLSWLSGRALVAQARGLLGSTPGDCRPFHFPLFSPHNIFILPCLGGYKYFRSLFATNFVTYWFMFEGMCSSCMCMVDIKQSLVYTQNIKGNKQLPGVYTGLALIHITMPKLINLFLTHSCGTGKGLHPCPVDNQLYKHYLYHNNRSP